MNLKLKKKKRKLKVANEHLNEVKLKKKRITKTYIQGNLDEDDYNELLSEIEKESKMNNDVINMSNSRINQLEDFIKSFNIKRHRTDYEGIYNLVSNYNDKEKQEACQRRIKSVSYFDDVLEVNQKNIHVKELK